MEGEVSRRKPESQSRDCGISGERFRRVASQYCRRWRVGLCAVGPDGEVVLSHRAARLSARGNRPARRLAVHESLRWGEPAIEPAPGDMLIWAVPLMHNAVLLGGLVAGAEESRVFAAGPSGLDVRAACSDLLQVVETQNLTNSALLEARRRDSQRERLRAEAIHAVKSSPHYDLRALYLLEEPQLIAAIRRGDRGQGRAILNRLLVGMIQRSGGRLELAKSFFMELVAMMSRTAVEAGAAPEELLGSNFRSLAGLSSITDEEGLSAWLRDMLERILDSIGHHAPEANALQLAAALRFMTEHCGGDITREDAARAASMSPSHFSRQFSRHFGQSFTEVLTRMRVDRAADLLLRSDKPLKLIARECGFTDQSYMTKLFRRRHGVTPAHYRCEHRITKI